MITPAQRQLRQKYLGSSDISAAMGLDPYRSKYDLWLEKTGRAEPFAGNEHTERGDLLEPVLLNWIARQVGALESHDTFIKGSLCYNPDALVSGKAEGIEAKTGVDSEDWGDPAVQLDAVPDRYVLQSIHGLYVADLSVMWVPVLLAGFRSFQFRRYCVENTSPQLTELVVEQGERFMEKHVRRDTPPEDSRPSLEVLRRMRRQPNKTVPIDGRLIDRLLEARTAHKLASDERELAETIAVTALGDAEAGEAEDGRRLEYLPIQRRGYSVEATTYRQLRVRGGNETRRAIEGALRKPELVG